MTRPEIHFSPWRPAWRAHEVGRQAQAGFTLLELMAVLGLMALFLGLVVPNLLRTLERQKNQAALRELTAALRMARSEAVTGRRQVRLFVNLKTGRYRLEGSAQAGELTGVRLTDARLVWQNQEKSQGYIVFYGDGSSSGGDLALVEPGGQRYLLEVKPITGKISLSTGGG
jgi:general secretion pathway protein H